MSFEATSPGPPSSFDSGTRFKALVLVSAMVVSAFFWAANLAAVAWLPLAVVVCGVFLITCFRSPLWAFAAFVFVHITIPLYVRLPPIGPLPAAPLGGAMWAILAATILLSGRNTGSSYRSSERLFIAFFLLYALIAALSLIDDRTTSEGINMWFKAIGFPFIGLLVAVRVMRSPVDVGRIFNILLVAGCIVAVYGILEFAFRRNYLMETYLLPLAPELGGQYNAVRALGPSLGISYRSFSVFTNAIENGNCVGMIYAYAITRLVTAQTRAEKITFGLAAAICFLGVAVTVSRGPVFAVVLVTIGITAVMRPPFLANIRFLLIAGSSLLVLLLFGWLSFGSAIEQRFEDVDNVTLRLKEWQQAIAMFGEHPVLGVGIGNFPQYQLDVIREHRIGPIYEINQVGGDGRGGFAGLRVAESTYLQLAAETGILGVLAFGAMIGTLFVIVRRLATRHSDRLTRQLGVSIGAGVTSYLVNGLTVTGYTHYVSTMLLYAVFFGSALVLHRAERGSHQQTAEVRCIPSAPLAANGIE